MRLPGSCVRALLGISLSLIARAGAAADYPAPRDGDWMAHDFHFHTGETMAALRLHYTTVGDPKGLPVLVLHGTSGSGASMLNPNFAGELFGPGQPLDARKYFIILPDSIGAGHSSRPSDGLRMKFPHYNYADIVEAQYRLLNQHLGIRHLRLVMGNSMGGMLTWQWGVDHPGFMDGLVPLASQPSAMASRNWALRRMVIEAIKRDPDWKGGDYTTQPRGALIAGVFFGIATSGGTQAWAKLAPTREAADRIVEQRLAARDDGDANDAIYQLDSARDYDPAPGLERITASVLAINSADDERNPAETGITERELKRVKNARLYLIPASPDTRGHGTTGMAKLWKQVLADWLEALPVR
jgi:homoserine O-acetyltransferase